MRSIAVRTWDPANATGVIRNDGFYSNMIDQKEISAITNAGKIIMADETTEVMTMGDNLLDKIKTLEDQVASLKEELMKQPFEKTVYVGYNSITAKPLNIEITYDGTKVVIKADTYANLNNACPSNMWYADDWSEDKFRDLLKAYQEIKNLKFHAGCIHQRQNWDLNKEITVNRYRWSKKFYNLRNSAANGDLSISEYDWFKQFPKKVSEIVTSRRTINTSLIDELLNADMIELEKTEKQIAVHTWPYEHKKGLLTAPCEICGYKYGSAWVDDPVSMETMAFLRSL
jgi:hypothetical protein